MGRRHHPNQKTDDDRARHAHAVREAARDYARSEQDHAPCTCGAITGLDPCPYCGGDRSAHEVSP